MRMITLIFALLVALTSQPSWADTTYEDSKSYVDAMRLVYQGDQQKNIEFRDKLHRQAYDKFSADCGANHALACWSLFTIDRITTHLAGAELGNKRTAWARAAAKSYSDSCRKGSAEDCATFASLIRAVFATDSSLPKAEQTDGLAEYKPQAVEIFANECRASPNELEMSCLSAVDIAKSYDPKFASVLVTKFCVDYKLSWSCQRIGKLSEHDRANEQKFSAACSANAGDGCLQLGLFWGNRASTAGAIAKSYLAFDKACNLGNANGCLNYGMMLMTEDYGKVEAAKALQLFQKGCAAGGAAGPMSCRKAQQLSATPAKQ